MEHRQRLFIYDRKEVAVLIFLAIMVSIFAFTFGVHMGKRLGPKLMTGAEQDPKQVQTIADKLPNRQELTEAAKDAPQAAEETLNDTLHEEVKKSGVKLDTPRQVELPEKPHSANAGATTLTPPEKAMEKSLEKVVEKEKAPMAAVPPTVEQPPQGKYTLQISSYQSIGEARDRVTALKADGLSPFVREVELKEKGKWYRIYLGGYSSKSEAEKAGALYREKHLIDSFIIAKLTE